MRLVFLYQVSYYAQVSPTQIQKLPVRHNGWLASASGACKWCIIKKDDTKLTKVDLDLKFLANKHTCIGFKWYFLVFITGAYS